MTMIKARQERQAKKLGDENNTGRQIFQIISDLFPICRSITGEGFRETMRILGSHIPLQIHEIASGTQVFDWTIPREWNIRDAYIKDSKGRKVIDFKNSNLHIVSYSIPTRTLVSLKELKTHLFTLPEHPEWIPYRTSYYKDAWGFCLTHNQYASLQDENYEAYIDSSLEPGALTYGELYLRGMREDEIIISVHACHPSLANDNLSGVATAALVARELSSKPIRYSYRFLFIPGTIGAIAWLCLNERCIANIKHGLVITGIGDGGALVYKQSRRGNAEIDRAAGLALKHCGQPCRILEFSPYGYDERQYCSPAFNLPVGRFSRTPYGEYPEYHTSADNLEFVKPEYLGESFSVIMEILDILEKDGKYISLNQQCEPQLGKRGLYSSIGQKELALLWVLNLSDGSKSLIDIAERSGLPFTVIRTAADALIKAKLLIIVP
jgi:aminopeptidase-like protein